MEGVDEEYRFIYQVFQYPMIRATCMIMYQRPTIRIMIVWFFYLSRRSIRRRERMSIFMVRTIAR